MTNENGTQTHLMPADYPDFIFFICVDQLFQRRLRSMLRISRISAYEIRKIREYQHNQRYQVTAKVVCLFSVAWLLLRQAYLSSYVKFRLDKAKVHNSL